MKAVNGLVALLLLADVSAHSQSLRQDDFIGTWSNADPFTQNLTGLFIGRQDNAWSVSATGACSPSDCIWPVVPFELVGFSVASTSFDRAFAIWDFGYVTTYASFHLVDNLLRVETTSIFRDNSGRANFRAESIFVRGPRLTAAPLGNELLITWSRSASNYVLETAPALSPLASWTQLTNLPMQAPDSFQLKVAPSAPASYFRLRQRTPAP